MDTILRKCTVETKTESVPEIVQGEINNYDLDTISEIIENGDLCDYMIFYKMGLPVYVAKGKTKNKGISLKVNLDLYYVMFLVSSSNRKMEIFMLKNIQNGCHQNRLILIVFMILFSILFIYIK